MAVIVKSGTVCAALALLTLAGCGKLGMGQDEMTWARAALDRNTRLQVVASDPQARTFTVRLKDSGELRVIPVDQVVAGPALAAGGDVPAKSPVTTDALAPGPAQPTSQADASGGSAPGNGGAAPANAGASAASSARGALAAAGESTPAEPEESVAAPAAQTQGPRADAGGPHADVATDAKAGRVLASGPGYSIKASGSKGASTRSASVIAARGTPVERLHDPIICQGSRLLHIDNRNLQFDGDAVSAQDGCEIHITNTHISAKGIGVLARAANVHIQNSEIEGESGAIDASDGAQVYAESSTFRGLSRRLARSAFHDLGGNVWN